MRCWFPETFPFQPAAKRSPTVGAASPDSHSSHQSILRDAAADDGDLCAVRCRLGISSLIPWLGTGKSSGTHARALTPACSMPASGSAFFVILLESYGVSAGNSAPLPDNTC